MNIWVKISIANSVNEESTGCWSIQDKNYSQKAHTIAWDDGAYSSITRGIFKIISNKNAFQ